MTFKNGGMWLAGVPLSGGVASYTTTKLPAGSDSISAVYSGSPSFSGSTSALLGQTVNQASTTTTLTSSLNPSNSTQAVTFTANVTGENGGTVGGTVTFQDGTKTLGTVTVSGGAASYTTSTLAAGSHTITATYNGNKNFTTSSTSLTQTVN